MPIIRHFFDAGGEQIKNHPVVVEYWMLKMKYAKNIECFFGKIEKSNLIVTFSL